MNLKKTILVGTLVATLAVPTVVFADVVPNASDANGRSGRPQQMADRGGRQDSGLRDAVQEYLDGDLTEAELEDLYDENADDDAMDFDTFLEVLELRQELKDGDITEDEFAEEMEDLDVTVKENKGSRGKGSKTNDGLRESVQEYLDGDLTEAELEDLYDENADDDAMDFDTFLEVIELREELKDGDITEEEFAEEMEDLDVPVKENRGSKEKGARTNNEGTTDGLRASVQEYLDGDLTEDELEDIYDENADDDAMDFDTFLAVIDLQEDLKNGDITKAEFLEEMEDLDVPVTGGMGNQMEAGMENGATGMTGAPGMNGATSMTGMGANRR